MGHPSVDSVELLDREGATREAMEGDHGTLANRVLCCGCVIFRWSMG